MDDQACANPVISRFRPPSPPHDPPLLKLVFDQLTPSAVGWEFQVVPAPIPDAPCTTIGWAVHVADPTCHRFNDADNTCLFLTAESSKRRNDRVVVTPR